MRQPFIPKDLDQLIRAINGLRRNNHVYVRLMRAGDGAIVAASTSRRCPPPSCPSSGPPSRAAASSPSAPRPWDFDLATDYAVTGSRLLSLAVER